MYVYDVAKEDNPWLILPTKKVGLELTRFLWGGGRYQCPRKLLPIIYPKLCLRVVCGRKGFYVRSINWRSVREGVKVETEEQMGEVC